MVYRVLTEMCLVIEKSKNHDGWVLSRNEDDKLLGCLQRMEVGWYESITGVNKMPELSSEIKIELRHIEDPAVQAVLMTDHNFDIGMSKGA